MDPFERCFLVLLGMGLDIPDFSRGSVAWADLKQMMYLIGATGTGKTTIERNLAKSLELANLTGRYPNAFIYLDVKGDDAFKFLKQYRALDPSCLTFLDPVLTGFSVNPIELPSWQDRQRAVSVYIGSILSLINQWYETAHKPFQVERIFRGLLSYLYQLSDSPTFIDLHDLTIRMMEEDRGLLADMEKRLSPIELQALQRELKAISGMREDAFTPVLTRLAEFAVDPYLQHLFSVRRSTVDFKKLISPGHHTIIRVAPYSVGAHIAPLIQAVVLLKVWFTVLERAELEPDEASRAVVVIVLDEFQDIQYLQAIDQIVTQARSKGLCLVLSHQTSAQLDDNKFRIITGNCATQASGRVSGEDARRLALIWDPQFKEQLTRALPTQPDFRWVVRTRAQPGEEQQPPYPVVLEPPPPDMHSDEEVSSFIARMKELYGVGVIEKSIFEVERKRSEEWIQFSEVIPLPKAEAWKVLCSLTRGPGGFTAICERTALPREGSTQEVVRGLYDAGYIKILRSDRLGNPTYVLIEKAGEILPPSTKEGYSSIGGEDAQAIALAAREHYLSHWQFFALARQDMKMKRKVDAVAFDYDQGMPIGVEVESPNHVQTHPEELRAHMVQVEPFQKLHVWCAEASQTRVRELVEQLPEDQSSKIKVFPAVLAPPD
jgi:hypothetical protein